MKIIKSLDPEYLLHRMATDQIVGVLADRDIGALAGEDMMLADGAVVAGAEPHAHAVVKLRKGVRFATGEDAVSKLGEKLDPFMAATFGKSKEPVWFHSLDQVEKWETSSVVKGLQVEQRIQKSAELGVDEAAVSELSAEALGAVARLIDSQSDLDGAYELAAVVKAEYDRRGLEVDESLEIFKAIWGYPAGKSALAKRLVAMMPEHKTYVEPFIGSGAVLFAKDKADVEVVNDYDGEVADAWRILAKRLVAMMPEHKTYVEPFIGSGAVLFAKDKADVEVVNDYDGEVADAWRILAKLTEPQIKQIQGMKWSGDRATFERMKKESSSSGDQAKKLHRFLYLSRFSYGNMRGKSFDPSSQGKECTIPKKIENQAPRVKGLKVYHGDYEKVCRKYDGPNTLHFLDPPYAGYNTDVGESEFDEERFFKMLKELKGKWIVTYGVKGKLPKMLKDSKFNVKHVATPRSIRTMRGVGGDNMLHQIIAYNYDPPGKTEKTEKAQWPTSYQNDLPDSAFLYIAPGGEKDEDGKTVPRTLRYFPVYDKDGTLDEAHARNAIARIPQSTAPGLDDAGKEKLQEKARKLLEGLKKKLTKGDCEDADHVEKAAPDQVLCFYHRDLDGVASAAVVKQVYPSADMVSINYGDEFPWDALVGRQIVFMVDFGMQPFEDMVRLKSYLDQQGIKFFWIDHHATALEDAKKAEFDCPGLRKIGSAGCELTWEFLHPDDPMPEVVRLAGRFDVWDHSDPIVMPVHYAMEATAEANDPASSWWKTWLKKSKQDFGALVDHGKAIAGWLEQFNAGRMKHAAFDVEFDGLNCVASNTSIPGSMQYESVRGGHDAAISFCFSPGNQWDVSMYALKPSADVGAICAAHGGGGHKGAGGFQCSELPFDLPKASEATQKAAAPEIKPLNFFKPMMPAEGPFSDQKDAVKAIASDEALGAGIGVQPMWPGVPVEVHSDGAGKVAVFANGDQKDISSEAPSLVAAASKIGESFIFVGDIVGSSDQGAAVMVGDVVYWRGKSYLDAPWSERQKALNQALPKAAGMFVPTPARVVNSTDKLTAAIKWATQIQGSEGVVLTLAGSIYEPGASTDSVVLIEEERILNALVIGATEGSDGWVYQCAVGPLSESDVGRMKEVVETDAGKFTPVGSTEPTSVVAKEGETLRVEVGEILVVDSADSATVTWLTSKVLERVAVKPATVADVRALARPHEIQKLCKILKRDPERHYVLSVVLEPNDGEDGAPLDPDAHREIYSDDEIWDACIGWFEQGSSLGVMHQREASPSEMRAVHNWIAPVDMEIDGEHVRKGSWLIGSLVLSADLWKRIDSGELNAWSVDGRALRRPERMAA